MSHLKRDAMKIRRNTRELAAQMSDWLRVYLPSTRFRSGNTIDTYETSLSLYLDFLEQKKGIRAATLSGECFRKEWIEEWIAALHAEKRNSKCTCDLRLSCIRSLLKYLSSKNVACLPYYLDACDIRKQERGHPRKVEGISKKAMKALFSVMRGGGRTEYRDRVLFTLMYDTAARVSEALSIKVSDLHLDCDAPYVVIKGKGDKQRPLVFSPETTALLKAYIDYAHGGSPHRESYLFFSRVNGKKCPLDTDAVNARLKVYAAKAHGICPEVPSAMHTHQIRHSACTHWYQDGIGLAKISRYIGHESIETTRIYLGISREELAEAMAKRENVIENDKGHHKKVKGSLRSLIKRRNDA